MQFNDVENDANKNPYFDQVLYGTDHIFSPQEFIKELKDFYAKWDKWHVKCDITQYHNT